MNYKTFKKAGIMCVGIIAMIFCIMFISTERVSAAADMSAMNATEFDNYLSEQGFNDSYKTALKALHEQHPSWVFVGLKTNLNWSDVVDAQAKSKVSLIHISMPDAYKSVASGNFNFDTHTYIGKDSSAWVTAAKDAVRYYLDPRNFLTEQTVFMFEDLAYHPEYQTSAIVEKILSATALPKAAAGYYIEAAEQEYEGETYSVSPVYLAARTRQEIGSTTFTISGDPFSYGGKMYMGLYNTYNIGATSGSNAAAKGLIYANGGAEGTILATTFLRPWNTLKQAIMGGALFICQGYIDNNQNTNYLQKFNVDNGSESVATHQYMTNIMAPYSESLTVFNNYESYGILDETLTFLIPIYNNMPASAWPAPPDTGNNNYYLDSLSVSGYEFTKDFSRFTRGYTLATTVPANVSKVTIKATPNDDGAKVTGTGSVSLDFGENKKSIKVTSTSGEVRTYTISMTRELTPDYKPDTPEDLGVKLTAYKSVRLTWDKVDGADGYTVSYNKNGYPKWYDLDASTNSYDKVMASSGAKYNFKVRAYVNINGEKRYSEDSAVKSLYTLKKLTITTSKAATKAIRVKWNNISGETGYKIYRATSASGTYKLVKTVPNTWSSWKDTGKTVGKRYYYKVRAYKTVDGKNILSPYSGYKSYKL